MDLLVVYHMIQVCEVTHPVLTVIWRQCCRPTLCMSSSMRGRYEALCSSVMKSFDIAICIG
jgi:hypothetical protein